MGEITVEKYCARLQKEIVMLIRMNTHRKLTPLPCFTLGTGECLHRGECGLGDIRQCGDYKEALLAAMRAELENSGVNFKPFVEVLN